MRSLSSSSSAVATHIGNLLSLKAQYNFPYPTPSGDGDAEIQAYPVRAACQLLADPDLEGARLLNAMSHAVPIFTGSASAACIDTTGYGRLDNDPFTYQVWVLLELPALWAS